MGLHWSSHTWSHTWTHEGACFNLRGKWYANKLLASHSSRRFLLWCTLSPARKSFVCGWNKQHALLGDAGKLGLSRSTWHAVVTRVICLHHIYILVVVCVCMTLCVHDSVCACSLSVECGERRRIRLDLQKAENSFWNESFSLVFEKTQQYTHTQWRCVNTGRKGAAPPKILRWKKKK